MNLDLSDEQRLIEDTARQFADDFIAPRIRESDRNCRFDVELARRLGEMGYLGAPVAEEYGGRGLDYVVLRADHRADRADRQRRPDRHLGPDVARLRLDRALGDRGAEAALAARPLQRRGVRLLRTDRAGLRLRRRRDEDPRGADRRRLADRRPEDVDLARQRRRRRAGLRPDRPREGASRARLLPGPDRRRRASRRRRSTASSASAPPTPPRSPSTRSRSATTRCSARSATASRSR